MKLGLYIHIPFCRRKCLYCDFPSFAGRETLYEDYTAALCREIAGKGGLFSCAGVDTIYIGGGTPTVLPPEQLHRIITQVYASWPVVQGAEFSIEANPGTVGLSQLQALRDLGVNRISFGVQSFNNKLLKQLGRIHTARDAAEAVTLARKAGFDNINLDLMFGLPEQTEADWADTLSAAISLGVEHISAYGLKIEEDTPFFVMEQQGGLPLPSEEAEEAMYDLVTEYLPAHGLARYEISNYALPGKECRHNLKYWQCKPYIGMGAGAHSFTGSQRIANTHDVSEYIALLRAGAEPAVVREPLTKEIAMAEFVFLALRTVRGLQLADFSQHFHVDFTDLFSRQIAGLIKLGLLEISAERAYLTKKGMKFGNEAFRSFLPE